MYKISRLTALKTDMKIEIIDSFSIIVCLLLKVPKEV